MYNRMRRIFVALGVALPLIVVVPASHAQQYRRFDNYGSLVCDVDPIQGGFALIFPASIISFTPLYWTAWVYHYDNANNYTSAEQTDWFYYSPPDVYYLSGGGWSMLSNTAQYWYIVRAHAGGSVYLQPFIWDPAIGQLIVNGESWAGSWCRVVNR